MNYLDSCSLLAWKTFTWNSVNVSSSNKTFRSSMNQQEKWMAAVILTQNSCLWKFIADHLVLRVEKCFKNICTFFSIFFFFLLLAKLFCSFSLRGEFFNSLLTSFWYMNCLIQCSFDCGFYVARLVLTCLHSWLSCGPHGKEMNRLSERHTVFGYKNVKYYSPISIYLFRYL